APPARPRGAAPPAPRGAVRGAGYLKRRAAAPASRRDVTHTTDRKSTPAPASMISVWAANAKRTASVRPRPETIRRAAPAPTWVAAPAGLTGSAAAAAAAQRNTIASGKLKPRPSAASNRVRATARMSHEAEP